MGMNFHDILSRVGPRGFHDHDEGFVYWTRLSRHSRVILIIHDREDITYIQPMAPRTFKGTATSKFDNLRNNGQRLLTTDPYDSNAPLTQRRCNGTNRIVEEILHI